MSIIISLIILGILLLLVEVLIIPGVGLAGVLGSLSFVGSSVYAFIKFDSNVGIIVTLINVLLILVMLFFALRYRTWKKLALETVIETEKHKSKLQVGEQGITLTRLSPMGKVSFEHQGSIITCEACSADNIIDPKTQIEITSIEDGKIYVKPIK